MAGRKSVRARIPHAALPKCPSGIRGLDEITGGGLPRGRPTLVTGASGCGKTLFSMEFLVRGALEYGEPGVFMAFEENALELGQNVASLGFDLADLADRKKLHVDYVSVERSEIEETGEYDLEGLFIRLGHAIDTIGAKRVVLDTIESLFGGFSNAGDPAIGASAPFPVVKGKGGHRRHHGGARKGRDHAPRPRRVRGRLRDPAGSPGHGPGLDAAPPGRQVSRLHARDERISPSSSETKGIFLVPVTEVGLDYAVSIARVSTGIPHLDAMLGGDGFYRGSSVLVTGTSGIGKTSMAATFVDAACRRGERCLYFAFEESPEQIFRNMRSIGINLNRWTAKRLLNVHARRPTAAGIETHLLTIHKLCDEMKPKVVILDPISNLDEVGSPFEVKALLSRLIDYFKAKGITTLFTNLVSKVAIGDASGMGISSLMDTLIQLEPIKGNGEYNRGLFILKSRGMAHSNQVREFLLNGRGIRILDVSMSLDEIVTGSARVALRGGKTPREGTETAFDETRRPRAP